MGTSKTNTSVVEVRDSFWPAAATAKIVDYLDWATWRMTASGLLRVDDLGIPAIEDLLKRICCAVAPLKQTWAMIHEPGSEEVVSHVHNKWATVIYYPLKHPCGLILKDQIYKPKGDDLLILPVGCEHGVEANNSEDRRFSIIGLYDA